MAREAAHPGMACTASDILSITIRQDVTLSLICVTQAGLTWLIHRTRRVPVRLAFPLLRATVGFVYHLPQERTSPCPWIFRRCWSRPTCLTRQLQPPPTPSPWRTP